MSSPDTSSSRHLRQLEIDRLLGGEQQGLEEARSHLQGCEACRRELERQQQEIQTYVESRARSEAAKLVSLAEQRVQARHSRRRISAIASLAAAAMVAFVFTIFLTRGAPLPGYTFSVSHGSQSFRDGNGSAPDVPRFAPHSRLRIDLRPATAVGDPPQTQVWAARGDSLQQLQLSVKASSDGALRLEGVFEEDFSLPPGNYTLWIFIYQQGDHKDATLIRAAIEKGRLPQGDGVLLKTPVVFDKNNDAPAPPPHSDVDGSNTP